MSADAGFDQYQDRQKKFVPDFAANDYEPLRFGVKADKMIVVVEYQVPSTLKVYYHYI